MGSSDKEIRDAIVDVTRDTYKNNPDALTVNHVRGAVVKRLDLDQDFFKEGSWKDESKRIIKEEIVRFARNLKMTALSDRKSRSV